MMCVLPDDSAVKSNRISASESSIRAKQEVNSFRRQQHTDQQSPIRASGFLKRSVMLRSSFMNSITPFLDPTSSSSPRSPRSHRDIESGLKSTDENGDDEAADSSLPWRRVALDKTLNQPGQDGFLRSPEVSVNREEIEKRQQEIAAAEREKQEQQQRRNQSQDYSKSYSRTLQLPDFSEYTPSPYQVRNSKPFEGVTEEGPMTSESGIELRKLQDDGDAAGAMDAPTDTVPSPDAIPAAAADEDQQPSRPFPNLTIDTTAVAPSKIINAPAADTAATTIPQSSKTDNGDSPPMNSKFNQLRDSTRVIRSPKVSSPLAGDAAAATTPMGNKKSKNMAMMSDISTVSLSCKK